MRQLFFINILVVFSSLGYTQNLPGDWEGNINVNSHQLPILFHFSKDSSGNIGGKWDSPAQKAMGLPFSSIIEEKDSVKLEIKMIGGSYFGKFAGADSMEGIWHQGNASLPLNFKRYLDTTQPVVAKNYPNEKEIVINAHEGVKLYGTLLSRNTHQKLAIIIAGSGPTDRNGNNPLGGISDNLKMLAHALDSQNIASFRYDKRAIAKSVSANIDIRKLVFDDYVRDAERITEYLFDTLGYKEIYLLGHSEGSLIGIIAAQHNKNVKGLVSIDGMGRPFDTVIKEQLNNNKAFDTLRGRINDIFMDLKNGNEVERVPDALHFIFTKTMQPYLISLLRYSPQEEIKKLKCPVLIVQGTCDRQISVKDAENLHQANKESILDMIPLMTHTLKDAAPGCIDKDYRTYSDPQLPINKKLVVDITRFIKSGK